MKLTSSEAREIKYIMTYMGINPHESWATKSRAVMKAFKRQNFYVRALHNCWSIRKVA